MKTNTREELLKLLQADSSSKMTNHELAHRLGSSHSHVRLCLRQLREAGLIEIKFNTGEDARPVRTIEVVK